MLLVQVVDELGDHLGVGVRLETVAALLQERLHLFVVGDDAVVDDHERVLFVGTLRMRVDLARDSVRRPARVRDSDVRLEDVFRVRRRLSCW